MKRMLYIALLLAGFTFSLFASDEKCIEIKDLPPMARLFLKSDFSQAKIISVIERNNGETYVVITAEDMTFEFDEEGKWIFINCNGNDIPKFLIPGKIMYEINRNCGPSVTVHMIRRLSRGRYDVELSNSLGLRFNRDMEIVDVRDPELQHK